MSNYKLSALSQRRLAGVDARLPLVIDLALTITLIDFGIPEHGGLRTAAVQKRLYDARKSKCDGTIKISPHQLGRAFDVYAYVDGQASWSELHLTHVATAILSAASQLGVPLKWGGHFGKSGWDKPHFEIAD